MRRLELFLVGSMMSVLLLDGCAARPQDPKPALVTYTIIEPNAFLYADKEKDPRTKIKLLDSWVSQHSESESPLLPFAYRDYIVAYSAISDYPHVIVYADKLLAFGRLIDLQGRLEALAYRAEAFRSGCSNPTFQTPDSYEEAKDTANQGLQSLGEWQNPGAMSDEEFRAGKNKMETLFNTVSNIANVGTKGENIANLCSTQSNTHDR